MDEDQMDQADSSDDCEIIDSIEIVKQEPLGSPEPAKESECKDKKTVENTQCIDLGVVKQEKEDKSTKDETMISSEPQTDNPPPDMNIKMENSPLYTDREPSEAINVPEVPKESGTTLENLERSQINRKASSTIEKEPETVPKIQEVPTIELLTAVKIKQEPTEKNSPPLPSMEVNFGASTSHCSPPPSLPPPESPSTIIPNLKIEPQEIDVGNVGVGPQFINLDDFTMDNKRKRGYCDPLGKFY